MCQLIDIMYTKLTQTIATHFIRNINLKYITFNKLFIDIANSVHYKLFIDIANSNKTHQIQQLHFKKNTHYHKRQCKTQHLPFFTKFLCFQFGLQIIVLLPWFFMQGLHISHKCHNFQFWVHNAFIFISRFYSKVLIPYEQITRINTPPIRTSPKQPSFIWSFLIKHVSIFGGLQKLFLFILTHNLISHISFQYL